MSYLLDIANNKTIEIEFDYEDVGNDSLEVIEETESNHMFYNMTGMIMQLRECDQKTANNIIRSWIKKKNYSKTFDTSLDEIFVPLYVIVEYLFEKYTDRTLLRNLLDEISIDLCDAQMFLYDDSEADSEADSEVESETDNSDNSNKVK